MKVKGDLTPISLAKRSPMLDAIDARSKEESLGHVVVEVLSLLVVVLGIFWLWSRCGGTP